MAEGPHYYSIPGVTPQIAVETGANESDLLDGALCLVTCAMESLDQQDATQQQWAALAALGLARAFIAEAMRGNHG